MLQLFYNNVDNGGLLRRFNAVFAQWTNNVQRQQRIAMGLKAIIINLVLLKYIYASVVVSDVGMVSYKKIQLIINFCVRTKKKNYE